MAYGFVGLKLECGEIGTFFILIQRRKSALTQRRKQREQADALRPQSSKALLPARALAPSFEAARSGERKSVVPASSSISKKSYMPLGSKPRWPRTAIGRPAELQARFSPSRLITSLESLIRLVDRLNEAGPRTGVALAVMNNDFRSHLPPTPVMSQKVGAPWASESP